MKQLSRKQIYLGVTLISLIVDGVYNVLTMMLSISNGAINIINLMIASALPVFGCMLLCCEKPEWGKAAGRGAIVALGEMVVATGMAMGLIRYMEDGESDPLIWIMILFAKSLVTILIRYGLGGTKHSGHGVVGLRGLE